MKRRMNRFFLIKNDVSVVTSHLLNIVKKQNLDGNGDSMDVVKRVLKMLRGIEAKLDTFISAGIYDKEIEDTVELRFRPLWCFVEGINYGFYYESDDSDHLYFRKLTVSANNVKLENILESMFTLVKILNERPLPVSQDLQQPDLSWILFKTRAFDDKSINNPVLLEIAWEFHDKFQHDPSVVKGITSLFSSKHSVKEWENLRDNVLPRTKDALDTNLFNLNLSSFAQLQSNIHKCVCYCSLFPKDYTFNKATLVHLWDSQDYLVNDEGDPEETVGDSYFRELLDKGYFFEYIDDTGDILRYKMPYLVNEFLKEMGRPEFCCIDEFAGDQIDDAKTYLHLCFIVNSSSWKAPLWLRTAKKLQSLLFLPRNLCEDSAEVPNLEEIFSSLTCLRALDLVAVNCESLPSTLWELKDLRYLRFGVSFANLPGGVTRLENLRSLDLQYSSVLVLPTGLHTNHLKHLYTGSRLIDMPGELKSFQILDEFIIISGNDGLNAIGSLNKLFTKLTFRGWKRESNLQEQLKDKFSILENLVSLCIVDCSSCKDLSHLSSLPHLRSLRLWNLDALMYIDNGDDDISKAATAYFPSLEYLMLANLPELKGWSSREQQHPIRRCRCLRIKGCPKMTTMTQLPSLESLELHNISRILLDKISYDRKRLWPHFFTLKKLDIVSSVELDSVEIEFGVESLTIRQCPKLKKLRITDYLQLLWSTDIGPPQRLEIHECHELEDIIISFKNLSNLKKMEIKRCEKLKRGDKSSGEAWEGLTSLHTFKVINFSNLASLETVLVRVKSLREFSLHSLYKLNALPEWIGSLTQLRRLAIRNCPFLTTLPESLGCLSDLQQLEIECCPRLRKIPQSFAHLTSLKQLKIQQCPKLFKRCQELNGQDFPLIEHIPNPGRIILE